jgi:hypothetical protein
MEYTKPRIVSCGEAQTLIQGGKAAIGTLDAVLAKSGQHVYNATPMAYDADE